MKYIDKLIRQVAFFIIVTSIFFMVVAFARFLLGSHDIKENQKIVQKIEDEYMEETEEELIINFDELKEINTDTVGYLIANNGRISYPVVKTKDNEYYLDHNYNKKKNSVGWIYADYKNKVDGSDKNLVLYGHNTSDESMFGSLHNVFKSSWQTDKNNKEIVLVTPTETYVYKIFSIYSIEPEDYYITTNFKNNKEFDKFVSVLKNRSFYKYDITVDNVENIITLSTCTAHGTKRIAIHAYKVSE